MTLFVAACAGVALFLCCHALLRAAVAGARQLERSHERTATKDLAELFVFVQPQRIAQCATLLAVLVAADVWLADGGAAIALPLMMLALCSPHLGASVLRRRRARALAAQLPDTLALLAGLLRAGQGLSQALAHLAAHQPAPMRQELQLLVRKQRLGVPLERALGDLRNRHALADVALLATAIGVSRELGGNLAEPLQRLSGVMRSRRTMEGKISSLTSQGRLQGLIVGLLPLLLLVVLSYMEPRAMRLLLDTPIGWLALASIVLLELTGFFLIRRIVRIEV